jgi:hypothetical protein
MNALQKVEQAGFSVELIDGRLSVTPASKLSSSQDEWIRSHRDELIQAVRLRDHELEASPPGHDRQPANDDHQAGPHVAIEQLPERLVAAATRVCREIHGDPEEAVREMLVDLTWNDPKDWDVLTAHFEGQLPPPPETALVRCSGCAHAEYRHHPSIAFCRVGVQSGNPTGGWWATDRHICEQHHPKP